MIKVNEVLKDKIQEAINRAICKGDYILGKEVEKFEKSWGDYHESQAIGVGSRTDALILAIRALGLYKRNILIQANTYIAAPFAISLTDNSPIFCDVSPQAWLMDAEIVEKHIEKDNLAAIIYTPLYGAIDYNLVYIKDLC